MGILLFSEFISGVDIDSSWLGQVFAAACFRTVPHPAAFHKIAMRFY
jgi:hypothetical protein